MTKQRCTMQSSVEDSGDEGLSEREFAMTVIYRINLHSHYKLLDIVV